ncbi:hypothetical protein [Candidatus Methylomirabilis limnetica]|uniref:hypothetical protein n=1 Tax=Candidatus Methylomirabilis limnetica TaxID=2033718 RepID=UPI001057408B|nr:hypothetical protein [Candidatus Methylomirabilis limnetica]
MSEKVGTALEYHCAAGHWAEQSGRWSLRSAVPLVILPEIIPAQWWQNLLYNPQALLIQSALLFTPSVIVTAVPYYLAR